MNSSKIILVDLDHTLIQTEQLRKNLFAILHGAGISKNMLKGLSGRADRKKAFHPLSLLRFIPERDTRVLTRRNVLALYKDTARYNFKGVEEFLGRLRGTHTLILVSFGQKHHQALKIDQSGLKKFFKKVVITTSPRKKKNLTEFYRKYKSQVLLLDDSKPVIDTARAIGMRAIRVAKGPKETAYYRKLLKRIQMMQIEQG